MAKRELAQFVAMGTTRMRTRSFGVADWLSVRWGFIRLLLKLYFNWYTLDYFTRCWLRLRADGLDNQDSAQVLDALPGQEH